MIGFSLHSFRSSFGSRRCGLLYYTWSQKGQGAGTETARQRRGQGEARQSTGCLSALSPSQLSKPVSLKRIGFIAKWKREERDGQGKNQSCHVMLGILTTRTFHACAPCVYLLICTVPRVHARAPHTHSPTLPACEMCTYIPREGTVVGICASSPRSRYGSPDGGARRGEGVRQRCETAVRGRCFMDEGRL